MDPSSSSEAPQASMNSNQPEASRTIIGMDPALYHAAENGKFNVFKDIQEPLDLLRTPTGNTILHIYLTTLVKEKRSTMNFVEKVLHKCPLLLQQTNVKGETLLHIAARYGHRVIVDFLIERARILDHDLESGIEPVKEMLRKTNKEKDTALHEVMRYGDHFEVVRKLVTEDQDLSHFFNNTGEAPLYMAVERRHKRSAFVIMDTCKSPAYGGPLRRTALHAAVTANADRELVGELLKKLGPPSIIADDKCWTPLHLAAYLNRSRLAKQLLKFDRQMAYKKDAMGRTALHIAVDRGNTMTTRVIISSCPDCCELVNNRGCNALHTAILADFRGNSIVRIFLKRSSLSNLLNEKDVDGNTPLHHQLMSTRLHSAVASHRRVDTILAFNGQDLNDFDRAVTYSEKREDDEIKETWKERNRKIEEYMQKKSGINLVMPTLITTVTFAAGITMPGGFVGGEGPHPGSAALTKSTAFKAFVMTDIISMVLSSCSVFTYLILPQIRVTKLKLRLFNLAWCLNLEGLVAMVLSFVTGIYSVLAHSLDLAIPSLIIGLSFFIVFFLIFWKREEYLNYN